jgi:hypothetical protein
MLLRDDESQLKSGVSVFTFDPAELDISKADFWKKE